MYDSPASRPWLSIAFDSAEARTARADTARFTNSRMSRFKPVLQFQTRPQRLGRGIDEPRRIHALVVGPAVGRTDLDVRLGRTLAARGGRAIRRGGVLQVGTYRPQVLLFDVEREVAAQGVAHVARTEVQQRDLVLAHVLNQAVADVQHHERDAVQFQLDFAARLAELIDRLALQVVKLQADPPVPRLTRRYR